MILKFEKLLNTRDLGGMITKDGRTIKQGMLIRSGQLWWASEADREKLGPMLGLIFDFRTSREKEEKPDPTFAGVEYIHMSIMDESRAGISRDKESDEEAVKSMAGDAADTSPDASVQRMAGLYGEFITNPFMQERYRIFLKRVLEQEKGAVLWHCSAGKDRAGFGAVLLEHILGVPKEDQKADYLATDRYLRPEVEMLLEMLTKDNPNPNAKANLLPMLSARPEYFDRLYSEAEKMCGSFDKYVEEVLGIDEETRQKFKDKYLE